jgi:hypothetical protein
MGRADRSHASRLLGVSLFAEGELVRRTLIGFREGRFRRR